MLPGILFALREIPTFLSLFVSAHLRKRYGLAVTPSFLVSILSLAVSQSAVAMEPSQVVKNLPLSFEENRGQVDRASGYLLRYNGSEAMFSPGGIEFRPAGLKLGGGSVRMRLMGTSAAPEGSDLLEGRSNYLIGADASKWVRDIPHFREIEYNHLYPGISLAFYGNGDALEHDFRVAPGAEPSQISFRFDGAEGVSISADGDLKVRAAGQTLTLRKPVAYQTAANGRTPVDAAFVLGQDGSVGFHLGAYDRKRSLVIDPVFVFSTYLGGIGVDQVAAVTTDASGNIYLAGNTSSPDFPTANPLQPYLGGCSPDVGCMNTFVTKLNPSGTALLYSTYLGGASQYGGGGSSIVVDGNGNAIVAGFASSGDFPTAGAIQSPACQINNSCFFLASLKPDGSALNYAGLIGGSGPNVNGNVGHVTVDSTGNAYLTGYTDDQNFQITPGTLATSVNGYPNMELFVLKVDPTGKLIYSTMVPGNATPDPTTNNNQFIPMGIAVDTSGQVTVGGFAGPGLPTTSGVIQKAFPYNTTNVEGLTAGFVLQINAVASAITFASYLPGTNTADAMAVDSKGNLYFGGWTNEADLPVSANAYQKVPVLVSANGGGINSGYIMQLSPGAAEVVAATYLDGTAQNQWESSDFTGIALDSKGNIFVGGETGSPDFPLQNPFTIVEEHTGNIDDMVLAVVNPSMSTLLFGSFLDSTDPTFGGSTFSGIAIDSSDKLIVAGTTYARDFPTTTGSFEPQLPPVAQTGSSSVHTFIAKIDMVTAAPSACLSSFNINFGSVVAGNSGTQTLNVTNCGNAPLDLSSIVLSDPTVTVSQNCSTIAVGAVCPVMLTFKPVTNGVVSGTIAITDNAVLSPPVVNFSGTGQAPKIATLPSSVIFPAQVLGVSASGAGVTILVQNVGAEPLIVNPANTTATGDFSIMSDGCTFSLGQSNLCAIQVSFTPTQLGQRTGTLTIASNDPANPAFYVSLSGTSLAAYPMATISALSNPSYPVTNGSTAIAATVQGTNFFPSSVVYVNGVAQPTTYQGSTSLGFSLSPTLLRAMAELPVTVVNPTPGGGNSASYPLTVYLSIPLQSSSLVMDPVGGLLYAAIPASAVQNPSTIIPIDPATGVMMTPVAVSSDPQHLAVSDDGSELYVATSAGVLQRLNLKTLAIEKTFSLPVDSEWGQTFVQEMHVVPGSPKSIVVALFANVDPAEDGAALYNDSGLVNWLSGVDDTKNPLHLDSFTFTLPTIIYGVPVGSTFFGELQVSSTGLSVVSQPGFECCNEISGSMLASDGTLLYTNSGEVWNPTTQTLLGTYLDSTGGQLFYAGTPVPDTANGHTYFLGSDSGPAINVYDQANYGLASTISFLYTNLNSAIDLVRWGSNGLAFRNYDYTGTSPSSDQIAILVSSKVTSNSGAPVPIVSSISPSTIYVGEPAYTLQINGSGFTNASTALINGQSRSTTYISAASLTVQVLASDIATTTQLNVQVTTPAPGGGTSNYAIISVNVQAPVVSVIPSSSNVFTTQALSVTVSVNGASGYPTPTGTVSLSSSIYSSAVVPLSGGSATISLPAGSLVIGTDTLTANYTPDSAGSSIYKNASGLATVSTGSSTKTTPSLSVMLSSSSITTAQGLTATATVNGGKGNPTPTGSVMVTLGENLLEEPALVNGSAKISIAAGTLPVGNDTIAVNYVPDTVSSPTYNNSTGTAMVTVTTSGKITPTVEVKLSASSITTAQALTVTVAINGGNGNSTPTGSIALSGGGFTSTAAALSQGNASISIPAGSLAVGNDTLTVSYGPDTTSSSIYNTSTGAATVTVTSPTKITPTVSVTPSASSITTAQALTVMVTVNGGNSNPTPTGSVTLSGGGFTSTATALRQERASISIPAGSLTVGNDTLTVSYTPDTTSSSTYSASTGMTTVAISNPIGTTAPAVTVAPSAESITNEQSVNVSVTVAGASGQATPTGTVTLSSGSYSAQQTLSSGATSFTIAAGTLANGADTLTASYAGDATYASASGAGTVTVSQVIIAGPTPSPVSPGSSAGSTVTLSAGSNYTGTMNLACALMASPAGAVSLPTCTLNPASVLLASGGSGTTTLTVHTTAASSSALTRPPGIGLPSLGGGAALAAVLIFVLPQRRRPIWMAALLWLGVAVWTMGCGSGGNSSAGQPSGPTTSATTAGNYTFAVTGTDSASTKITASTSLTITVQ
jgi:hypothetical protein